MTTKNSPATKSAERELVITRIFDAPRELVWKAWTDPQHVMRWWGPKDFTLPACQIDFRVGGKYLYCMRSPEGQDFWTTGVFQEIVLMERIVHTDCFADADGNVVPSETYGMEGIPEMTVKITFEAQGSKTKMTLTHGYLPAGELMDMTIAGWNESFDKLAESLK